MTCIDELLDKATLSPEQAAAIRTGVKGCYRSSGQARKVIDNLCCDPRLPDARRIELLLRAFAPEEGAQSAAGAPSNSPPTWKDVAERLTNTCHGYTGSDAYRDERIPCRDLPANRKLWHAMSLENIERDLDKRPNAQLTSLNALAWHLEQGHPPDLRTEPSELSEIYLSHFPMWATWDPATGDDPFRDCHADHVRATLGLKADDRGQPLILLGYTLPKGCDAWIPTVADAHTFAYFKPDLVGSGCGHTDPWHPRPDVRQDPNNPNSPPYEGIPRPEVTHNKIQADNLFDVRRIEP